MKKIVLVVGFLFCFLIGNNAFATTTFNIYNNLSEVYGFGFTIDSVSISDKDGFVLTQGPAVPVGTGGFWQVWETSTPLGVQGTDLAVITPLDLGLVATVTSDFEFSLINFKLGGLNPDGSYPHPWRLTFDASASSYTFDAVPIPSSLLLLGGGIFALVGISRRRKG